MACKGALNKFAEDVTLCLSLQRKIKVWNGNWIAVKVTGAIEMRTEKYKVHLVTNYSEFSR